MSGSLKIERFRERMLDLLCGWQMSVPFSDRQAVSFGDPLGFTTGPNSTARRWHVPVYVAGQLTDAFVLADLRGVIAVGRKPESEWLAHISAAIHTPPKTFARKLKVRLRNCQNTLVLDLFYRADRELLQFRLNLSQADETSLLKTLRRLRASIEQGDTADLRQLARQLAPERGTWTGGVVDTGHNFESVAPGPDVDEGVHPDANTDFDSMDPGI